MKIKFTKMHGAGNDYIYVNAMEYHIEDPAAAAVKWSRAHFSVGSDGLVLIDRASSCDADFSMRIFNNDGSEAMMCGNACRCIAKYLYDKRLTAVNPIKLETPSGIKILTMHLNDNDEVTSVTVDMHEPVLASTVQCRTIDGTATDLPLEVMGRTFAGTFVSMGNPHFVCFVDDVEGLDVARYGREMEHNPLFPQRCNIEFAQMLDDGTIRMRVWERGSGITLACGTGACATAVAACVTGRASRRSDIVMDGGTLTIDWREDDNHVYMTGPATTVFEGEINYSHRRRLKLG